MHTFFNRRMREMHTIVGASHALGVRCVSG
jgi:hypothetical protein